MSEAVLAEAQGAVYRISINRPERRNSINEDVCAGIERAISAAEDNGETRAIVITGTGDQVFCAGGDLKPSADGAPFTMNPADPRHYVVKLFKRMQQCRLPIIARINGDALAGGLGLVCACDLAVAVDTARFGVPETRVGLFPMMILPFMLRLIPRRRLMEMCITAELYTATEARELGIVNHVVPAAELDARLDELVKTITDRSPTAIRIGKQAFRAIEDMTIDQAFEFTQLMLPVMAMSRDAKEGFAAFNERRKPDWTGE
jgi:enoyl-CoA hydratase/carnithine racemase